MPDIKKYVLFDLNEVPNDVRDDYLACLVDNGLGVGSYLIKIDIEDFNRNKEDRGWFEEWEYTLHEVLQEKYPGAYKGEYDLMFWGPDY